MSSGSPSIAIVSTAKPLKPMPGITEDDDRLPRRPMQWLPLMVVAAIVGAGAGLVGGAFRLALVWLDDSRTNMAKMVYAHVPHFVGWLIPTALCAAGAYVSVWLTQTLSPQTAGSGIPRVEAALRAHLAPVRAVILPVKFIGGALSVGSGLALGREGPTVQMGGTLILPMMAASLTAYAVPELLGNPPIYDSLRERDELKEKERRSPKA